MNPLRAYEVGVSEIDTTYKGRVYGLLRLTGKANNSMIEKNGFGVWGLGVWENFGMRRAQGIGFKGLLGLLTSHVRTGKVRI
jgi:hypothetical protein